MFIELKIWTAADPHLTVCQSLLGFRPEQFCLEAKGPGLQASFYKRL
jgi:hypothetical protein